MLKGAPGLCHPVEMQSVSSWCSKFCDDDGLLYLFPVKHSAEFLAHINDTLKVFLCSPKVSLLAFYGYKFPTVCMHPIQCLI